MLQRCDLGLRIDLIPGPLHPAAGAAGRSRNANSNCMVALLSGDRLGESAEKSVGDGARLEQITDCAKVLAVLNISRSVDAAAPKPVRPG